MIDECPMTEDCPGFDRDARVCRLRPDDCEFAQAHAEALPTLDAPGAPDPEALRSPGQP